MSSVPSTKDRPGDRLVSILEHHRIVPVVVIDSVAHGDGLADALVAGGLPLAEVTLRTPASLECLAAIARRGDVLTGVGSVRTVDQVDAAVEAGARFVVSPGLSPAVVERCGQLGVPTLPGVATPSEIMRALDLGVSVVKLFPAGQLGGPGAVRALSAPFPAVRFVPTGGIRRDTVADYLAVPSVLAVGGSWMVPPDLLGTGDVGALRDRIADCVELAGEVTR